MCGWLVGPLNPGGTHLLVGGVGDGGSLLVLVDAGELVAILLTNELKI